MDHVVELSHAHSALADPILPRLNWQASRFCLLDLPPEVVGLGSEKVALPEYSAKELVWVAWEIACFEENGCFLFRWSAGSSPRHQGFTWVGENWVLPLILMVTVHGVEPLRFGLELLDEFT